MQPGKPIQHKGIIKEINGGRAKVSFTAYSACNACHAKGICSVAEMDDKSVDVAVQGRYSVGESVMIILEQTLGYKALFLGYLLPLIIVITALITLTIISGNEVFSALVSLFLLIPYYLIIYFLRDRIRREFSFIVRKI
ncbi:MAG: SoxR reducing system RseC family protein [Bacteroidales bacterium]|nr:MAG: SoxR reducing system RseC family protein [Bacteroidales bacterium]